MLFSDSFITISAPAEVILRERGSKFLGFIYPVSNEKEIKERLFSLNRLHPSANHHCYAWRLGPEKSHHRVNDDGEPSGTAGRPIFSQIQSNDLTNVLIVVVRYFGGTLLGVNGLIQAYRETAALAIASATIVEQFIVFHYEIYFGNEDTSSVMRLLHELEVRIISNDYIDRNIVRFELKKKHLDAFGKAMEDLYRASYKLIQ